MNLLDSVANDLEITPRAISSYLGTAGWELSNADKAAQIWELYEAGKLAARVMVPLDNGYVDFARRYNETLRSLCLIYDWDMHQLATRIVQTNSDLFYIRADQTSLDGSIPLRQAENLLNGASDMLLYAAWSTISPRSHYSGKRPNAAKDFIEHDVRMGHTQRGSFIITILARLEADDQDSAGSETSETDDRSQSDVTKKSAAVETDEAEPQVDVHIPPFQRRVMATLATGVQAAREAAMQTGSVSVDDAVFQGLSANLVKSIRRMTKYEGLRSLDLSFSWAPSEPAMRPDLEDVEINRDVIPNLEPLQERLGLRELAPATETIFGQVIRLERDDGDDDEGVVTIRGVIGKSTRRQAKVSLAGTKYDDAIRAHRQRLPVAATGALTRRGNAMWLEGDVHFEAGY
ncbi:hypothetical protein [Phytoactinopolyspora halotolerans]|uniref:Uncharacterized protein n=1 Tax=Phytoactinopolyspora halotolerans TaxID=1981512 RepID=A0A6L9SFG9_9ACTN|nr:hypothetical protein [Phytoactinopolyspora halotolerans]NEE03897.1 hypothetical protein [Phytoactinopolyspora halotolerans]